MYLNLLSKAEKELFLQACLHISSVDGSFSDDEKNVITQLCQEMQIPASFVQTKDLDIVLGELRMTSSMRSKKVILFELAGVVMADGVYDDLEKNLMYQMAEKMELSSDFVDEAIDKISALIQLYKKIGAFIN